MVPCHPHTGGLRLHCDLQRCVSLIKEMRTRDEWERKPIQTQLTETREGLQAPARAMLGIGRPKRWCWIGSDSFPWAGRNSCRCTGWPGPEKTCGVQERGKWYGKCVSKRWIPPLGIHPNCVNGTPARAVGIDVAKWVAVVVGNVCY